MFGAKMFAVRPVHGPSLSGDVYGQFEWLSIEARMSPVGQTR